MSCTTLWKSLVSSVFALAALGGSTAQAAILQIDTSTPVEFPNSVTVPVRVAAFTGVTPDANGVRTITGTITYNTADLDYDGFGSFGQIGARFNGTNINVVEGPAGTLTFTASTTVGNEILSSEGTILITNLNFSTTPFQGGTPVPNQSTPTNIVFNEGATTVVNALGSNATVEFQDNTPLDILTPACLYSLADFQPVSPAAAAAVPGVNFPVEYVNIPATGTTGTNFQVVAPLGCSFNVVIQADINQNLPLGSAPRVTITNIAGEAGLGGNGIPSGVVGGNGTNRVTFSVPANNTGSTITRAIRIAAPDVGRSRYIRLVQLGCSFDMLTPAVNNATAAAVNDFNVTFDTTCDWNAEVVDPADTWVLNSTGVGIFTGSGDGTAVTDQITYDLAANVGPARSAEIRVYADSNGNNTFDLGELSTIHTINQESGCEVLTLSPSTNNMVPAAGAEDQTFSFTLSDAACIAETTINNPGVAWITGISAPVEGPAGTFTITYDVEPNVGPTRGPVQFEVSAIQNGAALTHEVTQLNGCSLTISPDSDFYAAAGDTNTFDITLSDPGCGWTLVATDPWATPDDFSGTGNQTISVTADPNPGPARSTTIVVTDDNGVETVYTLCQAGNTFLEAFFYGDTETDIDGEDAIGDPQGLNIFVDPNFNDGGIYINSSETTVTINGVPSWMDIVEFNGGANAQGDIDITSGPTLEIGSDPLAPTFTYTLTLNDNDGVVVYTIDPSNVLVARTANLTLVTGSGIPPACAGLLGDEVTELTVVQSADCLYGIAPVTASLAAINDIATVANELEGSFRVLSNDILVNNNGCTWSATTSTPWISITAPSTGVGTGTVNYVLTPNLGRERVGTIELATENGLIVHTITQAGACGYDLNDDATDSNVSTKTTQIVAAGSNFNVLVSAAATCGWTLVENSDWLEISFDPATGVVPSNVGNATFNVVVDANQGPARFTTINLIEQGAKAADKTNVLASIRVQQASGCVVLIDSFQAVFPENETISGAVLTNSFPVSTGVGCTWTATESSPWITLLNASGTGDGFVIYTVDANVGPRRQAVITVGAFTHTVIQESGCLVTVEGDATGTTTNLTPAGSAAVQYDVATTGDTCTWKAVSNAPWITISNPALGNGVGTTAPVNNLTLAVAANTSFARTGTVTITGDNNSVTITVNQEDGCTINAFVPATATYDQNGGSGIVPVTFAGNGANSCDWTATVNYTVGAPNWLVISEGGAGTGNGFVNYLVDEFYTGGTRQATITVQTTSALAEGINPRVFTINQSDLCLVDAVPAFATFSQDGGQGDFIADFNAPNSDGCPWTASIVYLDPVNTPILGDWLTINSSTSGNGETQISYSVDSFFDGGTRQAQIRVTLPNGDNAIHLVTQNDNCTPVVTPAVLASNLSHSAQTGSFQITGMLQDCPWTASIAYSPTGVPGWVELTSGNSGSSNGLITYTVQPYLGDDFGTTRTATITITSQNATFASHTFTQASDCTFDIAEPLTPASSTFDQQGGDRAFTINLAAGGTLDCDWTAVSSADWIQVTGDANGIGNGTVEYNVDSFFTGGTRTGTIVVTLSNGEVATFNVTQNDLCDVTAAPATANFNQDGGAGSFLADFATNATMLDCPWDAAVTQGADWVTLTGSASGEGDSTVAYTVAPYFLGGNRVAIITVTLPNGDTTTHTITQTDNCVPSSVPSSLVFNQNGGTGNYEVRMTNGGVETCPWAVSTDANWVTITGDGNGAGNGTVQYSVDEYFRGGTRTAIITVTLNNGLTSTHTVTQTDECAVTLVQTSSGFNQNGGAGGFAINFQTLGEQDCPWEASTTANWVTITGDGNGSGNSELQFNVEPWFLGSGVGAQRTATITVLLDNGVSATHTVTQTNECDVTANPATATYNQNGGAGNFVAQFAQANQLDCPWTVSVDQTWVTLTGSTEGTGTSTIGYEVDTYFLGGSRTAIITVTLTNGDTTTHTITQTDQCVVTLVQTTSTFNQNGGTGGFSANFQAQGEQDCPWEASTSATWVTITGDGNGAGNSELQFEVAPWFLGNGVGAQRTATITVLLDNGTSATHTVTQTNECDVTAVPATQTFDQGGNSGQFIAQFAQNNQLDCPFNASVTTGAEWITLTGTTEGTGTSTISYDIAPFFTGNGNPPSRTGVITVTLTNGDVTTHTITQTDFCDHFLVPTSIVMDNNGGFATFDVDFVLTSNTNTQFQCPWIARVRYQQADPDKDWVQIVEGSTEGTGKGLVTFNVDEYFQFQGQRVAFIDVILDNGSVETFTITQRDLCQFTVDPIAFTFDHNGVLTGPIFDSEENNSGTAYFNINFLDDTVDCKFTVTVFSADADTNWINIQEVTRKDGDAQVFFEVDPNLIGGPDRERIGTIIVEGDNGQPPVIVTVVQSEAFYTLSQLELADPFLQTPEGFEQDGRFGFGANAVVIGYTDINGNQVIEQDNRGDASYFTYVDPKTNQVLEATLNVSADARGYITGFVTIDAFSGEFDGNDAPVNVNGSNGAFELGTITFPVTGRINYRRTSKTIIDTADNNYSGVTDVTYNSSFSIKGTSANKAASFTAVGKENRKEIRVFTPGESVGFDVVTTAKFKTGVINATGKEPRARLLGWNPTSVNLAIAKNSFKSETSKNTLFTGSMLLLDSDYSVLEQQGNGAYRFRQAPAKSGKNGTYNMTGQLATYPAAKFSSIGLHNLNAEDFTEEGFVLDRLDRGVNVFPQRTSFSNGQVVISGRNFWKKELLLENLSVR